MFFAPLSCFCRCNSPTLPIPAMVVLSNVTANNGTGKNGTGGSPNLWDGELFCDNWCFLLGLGVTLTSSSFHTAGALLQKIAHQQHESATERGEHPPKCLGTIPVNPYWLIGLICLVIIPSPLDTLAFSLAGESLVIPVGMGCNVLLSQLLAPFFTSEYPGRRELLAASFVVVGCSLTSIFGTHHTPKYTYDELVRLSQAPPFVVAASIAFVLLFTCIILYVKKPTFVAPYRIILIAFIPALFGAVTLLALKTVGEMIKQAIAGYSYWDTFFPYLFIIILLSTAIPQITFMNAGLDEFPAIHYVPIYEVSLMIYGVVLGAIYYKEYTAIHPVMFPLGLMCVCIGIALFNHKVGELEVARVVPHWGEEEGVKAATTIQSIYRGSIVRENSKTLLQALKDERQDNIAKEGAEIESKDTEVATGSVKAE